MKGKKRLYTIEDLEQILDYIPYEIWLKDKDGNYIYTNQEMTKSLGLKEEQIIGKKEEEIRIESFWEKSLLTDNLILEEKKPLFYEEIFNVEGKDFYYNIFKFPIKDDEDNVVLNGGIAQPITNNKYIENDIQHLFNEVQKSEDKNIECINYMSNILTKLNELIGSYSISLFFINETRTSINMLISSSDYSIFKDKCKINIDYNNFSKNYNLKTKDSVNSNINNIFKNQYNDNYSKEGIFKSVPLIIDNNLVGLMYIYYDKEYEYMDFYDAFIYDVSYRLNNFIESIKLQNDLHYKLEKSKQNFKILRKGINNLEETIESEIIKINFLQNMSHEFKTPLNIILMTSNMIISQYENNKFNLSPNQILNYLQYLKNNSYRLLRLVNNILYISKFDNTIENTNINMYNLNIVEIIEDIVFYTAEYIKNTNKKIIFDTEEEEIILKCDPILFEKIMLNIISNALKFTNDDGNITVNIKVNEEEKRVYVHTWNDSVTIKKEDAELIFNKFVQINDDINRQNEGSGIGLYLVKYLIELHNGKIWLNTDIEEGTEFVFYLPLETLDVSPTIKVIDDYSISEKCKIEYSDIYF